jgi:hypothetical protein
METVEIAHYHLIGLEVERKELDLYREIDISLSKSSGDSYAQKMQEGTNANAGGLKGVA